MDYTDDPSKFQSREPIKPVFLIIPSIISGLVFLILLIIKLVKKQDFISWGILFFWIVFSCIISFGISIGIYLLVSLKELKPSEKQYNSRGVCDNLIRKEITSRTGYALSDFSETAESTEGVINPPTADGDDERIYYHLYRINIGSRSRYLLGLMNMEKGKEDLLIFTQNPTNIMNFDKIREYASSLCRNPERIVTRERTFRDDVSGRSETVKEKSPLDFNEEGVDVNGSR